MMVGENIHNAFVVVFKTLQEIEKLIGKCRTDWIRKNITCRQNVS